MPSDSNSDDPVYYIHYNRYGFREVVPGRRLRPNPNAQRPYSSSTSSSTRQFNESWFNYHNLTDVSYPSSLSISLSNSNGSSLGTSGGQSPLTSFPTYAPAAAAWSGYSTTQLPGPFPGHSAGATHSRTSSTSSHGSGYEADRSESDYAGEETANAPSHRAVGHGRSANAPSNHPAAGQVLENSRNSLGSDFSGGQYGQFNHASSSTAAIRAAAGSPLYPVSAEAPEVTFWTCGYCGQRILGTATETHCYLCDGFRKSKE
ncbi:hypothetical protein E1B28_013212 [Marasmius oreades]|uniref:Uncharacterized protein n=1 Tax=Marasmius oreades TaxID=181124 RepID=A0A9P7RQ38_9AGAR|nr:uncharacterized protein E1B28_013212 [Marasmius oreades]KAG7087231.1 hypothetical protein E1B28_013212 [Marasmius oreades]